MSKASKNTVLEPIQDMKTQLSEVHNKLEKAYRQSTELLKSYEELTKAWTVRWKLTSEALRLSDTPGYDVTEEGLFALKALTEQANLHKLTYEKFVEKEQAYNKQLKDNLSDVKSKITEISSIQSLSSLEKKLKSLTAGTDIAAGMTSTVDDRSIQKLVFTAQALIELNKDRSLA